jgi:hypothetical protein
MQEWEAHPPEDAPELPVVLSGTIDGTQVLEVGSDAVIDRDHA